MRPATPADSSASPQGRAEALPYLGETFDLVCALDVVEHVDDDLAALKELGRVLRPGGALLVFVPAFMWLWGVQDEVSEHRRRYTRGSIADRLRAAGFRIERATYVNTVMFLPILAGRLLMRVTGISPASENDVTPSALNGVLGSVFGAERFWLTRANLPLGVSVLCIARKP